MRTKWIAAGSCLIGLSLSVVACGGDDGDSNSNEPAKSGDTAGKTLTIYSSLPLQGASRLQAQSVVDGAKLALEDAGGKAGPHTVKYVSLDDSTAQSGAWTPEAESANARKATQDDSTAVYLGDDELGRRQGLDPDRQRGRYSDDLAGQHLRRPHLRRAGLEPGEPDKYYPSGERNYARIVPRDAIQGAALVTMMKEDGCKKVAMTNDKEVYGTGLARVMEQSAKEQGLTIASDDPIDKNASNYRSLASKAKGAGVDCFVYAGITANNAVQQFKDFAAALGPDAKLYGPDGICETGFASEKDGGIPASIAPQFKCTVATLAPDQYPPAAQKFFDTFKTKYNVTTPDPYSIYGYEAMNLALDAIKRSGTGERKDILKAVFATKDRDSVLGTYSIDPNGDTTVNDYGSYTIKDGELVFDKTIKQVSSHGCRAEHTSTRERPRRTAEVGVAAARVARRGSG